MVRLFGFSLNVELVLYSVNRWLLMWIIEVLVVLVLLLLCIGCMFGIMVLVVGYRKCLVFCLWVNLGVVIMCVWWVSVLLLLNC